MTASAWTSPVPISWPVMAVIGLNLCMVAYVLGANRMSRYQDHRIEWVVGEIGRLRTATRMLYGATGYQWPDLDEAEEPQPARWERFLARLRRQQRDGVRGRPVADEAGHEPESDLSEDEAHDVDNAATDEPDPSPDTGRMRMPEPVGVPTQPDMKQAAQVGPLPADSYAQWKAELDARFERDVAEIRGEQ